MVASISARKSAGTALGYYRHMGEDDYYARDGEAPGRWEGRGAERLSLDGPVEKSAFEAALSGRDPKTGALLVQANGRAHAAGWDMTFSAPKSVSVLWALSPDTNRADIETAHRNAVLDATRHLEDNAAWARRGKAGARREPTAGLLMAQFDHHMSRALDPQLHTHVFIFNLAPRRDGSWGAIMSRPLYLAQKEAGRIYRDALARTLERLGWRLKKTADSFRVAAIPPHVERAFSKRRQEIERAAESFGYNTPEGMERAALRTRQAKKAAPLEQRFEAWRQEARAFDFELKPERNRINCTEKMAGNIAAEGTRNAEKSPSYAASAARIRTPETARISTTNAGKIAARSAPSAPPAAKIHAPKPLHGVKIAALSSLARRLTAALDGPARMSGVRVNLREKRRPRDRERER
ncbi:MAG: relaxase domain-containing protein [Parvularculaceae bacterium]|nr:relaxase domain-containing protein [Parvularculaceae bacterium]